jgi:hypothetical protein
MGIDSISGNEAKWNEMVEDHIEANFVGLNAIDRIPWGSDSSNMMHFISLDLISLNHTN